MGLVLTQLNKTARAFIKKHNVKNVKQLLEAGTTQENNTTWKALSRLRNALIKIGFEPDVNRFLITPI